MPSSSTRRCRSSPAAARTVQEQLQARDEGGRRRTLDFERAALLRDRLRRSATCSAQGDQSARRSSEADVFAIAHEGGQTCVQVFFFRAGQNWGNRAYFPRADRSLEIGRGARCLHRPVLRRQAAAALILLIHEIEPTARCSRKRCRVKAGHKVEILRAPARRRSATSSRTRQANAREALGRRLAESATQRRLLAGRRRDLRPRAKVPPPHRGLRQLPHLGHQRRRRHDRRRPGRLREKPVPQVQHQVDRADAGRRLRHDARGADAPLLAPANGGAAGRPRRGDRRARGQRHRGGAGADARRLPDWPDLVFIDGGHGQLMPRARPSPRPRLTDVTCHRHRQGPGPRCRPREFPYPRRAEPLDARAARPGALLRPAPARRGPPLRHRHPPRQAQQGRSASTRSTRSTASARRRKRALLQHFGSAKAVSRAGVADLAGGRWHLRLPWPSASTIISTSGSGSAP